MKIVKTFVIVIVLALFADIDLAEERLYEIGQRLEEEEPKAAAREGTQPLLCPQS